jgi:hypothetical protein
MYFFYIFKRVYYLHLLRERQAEGKIILNTFWFFILDIGAVF